MLPRRRACQLRQVAVGRLCRPGGSPPLRARRAAGHGTAHVGEKASRRDDGRGERHALNHAGWDHQTRLFRGARIS